MEALILGALVVLLVLLVLLLARLKGGATASLEAALKEAFLNFQASIHQELGAAREEVNRSKDLMAEHALKTIATLKEIGEVVFKLSQQQEEAQKIGASLRDILTSPKLRGSYGETVLEEMLDRVLPQGIWERQYTIEGQERVDAVIKFKEVVIPIDAKFPREDYQRYLDAPPEEKPQCWKAYEQTFKAKVSEIRRKYVKPEKGTTDFALMFIPSEAIYYETIAAKNHLGAPSTLFEFAQEQKVIPVSPNTFYIFLQVLLLGFRNLEIAQHAKRIQEGLASLERSFGLFYKRYEEIGKNLEKCLEAYRTGDTHINRYRLQLESVLRAEDFPS